MILSDEGRDLLHIRNSESRAKTRGYSFARAGGLWIPKRRKLECWGGGVAGFWAPRSMGAPRDTPLTLPGFANLESWHYAGRGLTLGATLKRGGTTAPADMTITAGDRQQSIGLVVKTPSGGVLGTTTYEVYNNGGTGTPIQSGTTAGSGVLAVAPLGLTLLMPPGTYNADNVYEGVVESWANLTPKTRTLLSVGAVSAQPTILSAAQNNHPAIHSDGGSTGYLECTTGDWAAQVASGTDSDFTVFLLCKTDSAAPSSVRGFLSFGNSADGDSLWSIGIRNAVNNYRSSKVDDGGTGVNADGGALDTNYHVLALNHHGTTLDMRDNGVTVFTGSSQNVGLTTLDQVCMFGLMRAGVVTNALNGAVVEFMTYNASLSSDDFLAVDNYLRKQGNV